ncbi:putative long-chain fatty acid transport protein [Waddlia chondrophila 2032/99]|uniref:Putative long-chain fatty acid transport protein n=1 Tax=Waddlia chondrophila 2032/99 TaxID=765953 RepID=F8LCI6_9BACT|nr:putative long-chain fatty acid transport protein [Waddlia chondrophila 2032/99]
MNKKFLSLLSSAILLLNCEKAFSSGFFLIEQSVSAMGTAYASGSAYAEDASTIWFNPAGMTKICGRQFVGGGHGVFPSLDYNDEGSIAVETFSNSPEPGGIPATFQPLIGNDSKSDEPALVGQSYFSAQLNNRLWVGLGITAPYGLVTDYGNDWKGRYHAIRSAVLTVNINPSIAWKINDRWSIGAGFSAMYLHAKLTNAVDFGLIGVNILGEVAAGALGLVPQQSDGTVELKGNSWGYGGNAGILYEPCCGTRIGFSYRSEVKHKVKGEEKFKVLPPGIENSPLAAGFQDTGAKADITLPMQLSLSGYHELSRCFAIMGDVTWTKWSSLQELRFVFDNPGQPENVTTFQWKNSFRYSLGVHYRPSDCFIARFGVSYDETPVPNSQRRTPRVPDEDRFWIATGVGYKINSCTRIDIGYAHLFARDPEIDKSTNLVNDPEDWFKGGLLGKFNAKTDIISAQVVVNF